MTPVLAGLQRFAALAGRRSDVVVAAFLMLAIVMMIIPLPKGMIDVLIGVNMTFSLLVLVVAFYIKSPVEFSSLPPVILISTLFRLALSISITRLILVDADAGQIVQAFGEFVIAGNVVVGLVVGLPVGLVVELGVGFVVGLWVPVGVGRAALPGVLESSAGAVAPAPGSASTCTVTRKARRRCTSSVASDEGG